MDFHELALRTELHGHQEDVWAYILCRACCRASVGSPQAADDTPKTGACAGSLQRRLLDGLKRQDLQTVVSTRQGFQRLHNPGKLGKRHPAMTDY